MVEITNISKFMLLIKIKHTEYASNRITELYLNMVLTSSFKHGTKISGETSFKSYKEINLKKTLYVGKLD